MKELSEEDINELYTYCALNEDEENIVAKISEMNEWKKAYVKSFTTSYVSELQKPNSVRALYCDPDTTYKKGFNHHFFEQLVKFLNKRECRLKDKVEGEYEYTFEEDKGIKVEDKKNNDTFYLKSDQLGFSAPINEKVYPYDLFLIKSRDIDKALEQVANWIISSRTIGSSFLWPEQFYKKYNLSRGGKIDSKNKYYIQDRVDLTLWEIFYWYENNINNDSSNNKVTKMTSVNDEEATDALEKWLSHFKTFETYIEFFCFQDFVNEKSCPINILSGSAEEPQWNNTSGRKPGITKQLDKKTIYKMLDRVNTMILRRSMRIEELIK